MVDAETLRAKIYTLAAEHGIGREEYEVFLPEEWRDRGERVLTKASLMMVIDGLMWEAFYGSTDFPEFPEQFDQLVKAAGYWVERADEGTLGFYPAGQQVRSRHDS